MYKKVNFWNIYFRPVAGGGALPPRRRLHEAHFFWGSFWRRFRIWVLIGPFGGLFRDIGGLSLFGVGAFCFAIYFKFISKNTFENNFIN